MTKSYDKCAWLKAGELEVCGKSCCKTYCEAHLAKIRKGCTISAPVGAVEKGFEANLGSVGAVDEKKIRHWLIALEQKTRRQFDLVLEQLFANRTLMHTHTRQPT